MKKIITSVILGTSLLSLTSCGTSTLKCETTTETFEYKYNKEELLEYKYNGDVQTGTVFETAKAAVESAGGIDKYIENTKTNLESLGATCK